MRTLFDQQLELLNAQLITMGALCEQAISTAARALLQSDPSLRRQVMDIEHEINQKEQDIQNLCLKLLLHQQPVARDLRVISSALKMISDMERIGDQAADIAEISRDFRDMELLEHVPIRDMALATIQMVTNAVDSFVRKDLTLAQMVMSDDDKVDELFIQVRTLLARQIVRADSGEGCIDLLMIAKYFERIGDHAVNIAEWVDYSLTGHPKDLT